ncbi:hypothetical protein J6590_079775 [Homalodisca vitripennis]|nr:hypothetical protein J6590_079775 [Homalodisca vitripennis]
MKLLPRRLVGKREQTLAYMCMTSQRDHDKRTGLCLSPYSLKAMTVQENILNITDLECNRHHHNKQNTLNTTQDTTTREDTTSKTTMDAMDAAARCREGGRS